MNGRGGFDLNPFIVIWELTRACDLACLHCRAEAQAARDPLELTHAEGLRLLEQVRDMGDPLLVFTGGDPLKRPDVYGLISHAVSLGLRVSVTPSGTPLLDGPAVRRFKDLGVSRMALSLDGPDAEVHDRFRGVQGSFGWTLAACRAADDAGLEIQINTTLSPHNLGLVDRLADRVEELRAVLWSVFFVVPVGRAGAGQTLSAEEFEDAFGHLHRAARRGAFDVKTTEAPHYRRYLLQHGGPSARPSAGLGRVAVGIGDGRGFVFISHTGDVYPSGFLPLAAGNLRQEGLADIYRDSPLFKGLRNPDGFKGKCGVCEFRQVCGGSRARAYAVQGDPLGWDPACLYQPGLSKAGSGPP